MSAPRPIPRPDPSPPPKPQADIFAKVDDPRLEEYRLAESLDLMPFYRELDGEIGPTVSFGGRQVVMLGSNNYLGLTTDPRVRAAAAAALDRFGTGITGSRLLNGTLTIHHQLEELLADWVGMEAALVFTTGYSANLGLLGALVGPDDATVVDSAAHASLVDGARFSGGTLRAFRHNRANSLRRTLRSWREQPDAGGVLVAVDGIYSMEGDWAPLPEISALCADFGARLLVDEAHALGVAGHEGAGTAAATGVRPDLIMGTFSKSLASCGGFIAGPRAVIEYLKITCRP
ncbi:MAG TPA: aminotransferase class I/II-fold pyridoxal phosphate-dependent enzyme, partial [Acidimicrobiales bacterium]